MNYNQPVFRKEWYIDAFKSGPKKLYIRIRNDIKWAYQRIQRGFSDYDACDIDVWFEYIMPSILEKLKNELSENEYTINCLDEDFYKKVYKDNNIPKDSYKVKEESLRKVDKELHNYWTEKIDKMIYLFTEMNKDECSKKDELNDKELEKYCDGKRKEAFEMLNQYFHNLWY